MMDLSKCFYPTHILLCYVLMFIETAGEVHISRGPENQRVHAGQTVTLQCSAGASSPYAAPLIEWRKDDEIIEFVQNSRFVKSDHDNSLILSNTSSSDSGIYTCIARFGRDNDKSSAQLIVEDVPDPPIDVELMGCQSRLAQIQWKLINENYSPVIQFIIQYNTSFDPDTWHVAKGSLARDRLYQRIAVSPWGNYSYRVIAQNSVGYSRPSRPTKQICHTPPDVPHHNPSNVCTRNGKSHTLVITWQDMPISEHNAPGFYYLVKWRRHDIKNKDEFEEVMVEHGLTEYIVAHVPIYKAYDIYVLAINSVGEAVMPPRMILGHSSEDRPLEIPYSFRLHPEKEVTSTTADFIWDPINTGPWRMQGFFVGFKIQFWKTRVGITTMREHTMIIRPPRSCLSSSSSDRHKREVVVDNMAHLYNLWPFTNITAQIVVLNVNYQGQPSNQVTFATLEGVPDRVDHFAVISRGATHLQLSWQRPQFINGILTGYSIAYEVIDSDDTHRDEFLIYEPTLRAYKLKNLLPDRTYRIHIWAHSRNGPGEEYVIEEKTMPEGPPVAPNFTTVNISQRAINITWFPSTNGNPGSVFSVHYRKSGQLFWVVTPPESEKNWVIIEDLDPGVAYEMRVIARNGDAKDSLETSSPLRRVHIGMRRESSAPTFRVLYLDKTSFGVGLKTSAKNVVTFFVQYRTAGETDWRATDDLPKEEWAVLRDLEPDQAYQIRVIAKSDIGEFDSQVEEVIAGHDPNMEDAQAARSENGHVYNDGSTAVSQTFYPTLLICISFSIVFSQLLVLSWR